MAEEKKTIRASYRFSQTAIPFRLLVLLSVFLDGQFALMDLKDYSLGEYMNSVHLKVITCRLILFVGKSPG